MEALNPKGLISHRRIQTSPIRSSSSRSTNQSSFVNISAFKYQRSSRVFRDSLAWSSIKIRENNMIAVFARQGNDNDVHASAPTPGPSSGRPWCNWLVGVIMSLVLPFASKWSRLLAVKNEVDTVVRRVETVAETVETVAEEVVHVSKEVAHQLPEGGKMHKIISVVANVAEETAKDARLFDQLIEKAEDLEKEVETAFVGGALQQTAITEVGHDEVTMDDALSVKELQEHDIAKEVSQGDNIDD